ncbi:MAG: 3'-5' exonuclease [Flavobacteriales bacterium]
MLGHINPRKILFLDIETVPQVADYESLSPAKKALWAYKVKQLCGAQAEISPGQCYESRAGIYAEFGKIICVSCGLITAEEKFRLKSFFGDDERDLLECCTALLSQNAASFPMLCAHNGQEFDFPYLSRRLLINRLELPPQLDIAGKKPWEIAHLDTMTLWRFGDRKSFTSLALLAAIFDIPTPKSDIDGSEVATAYYREKNLKRIVEYCERDVLTVAQLMRRYRLEPLLNREQPA